MATWPLSTHSDARMATVDRTLKRPPSGSCCRCSHCSNNRPLDSSPDRSARGALFAFHLNWPGVYTMQSSRWLVACCLGAATLTTTLDAADVKVDSKLSKYVQAQGVSGTIK